MNLATRLGPEQILLDLEVNDKWELIDRLVEALLTSDACRNLPESVLQQIRPAVINREKQMTTGLGEGCAFPHARVPGFTGFAASMAILKNDPGYESIDGKPVRLCCLMVTPQESPTIAIRAMSMLTSLLSEETARSFLLKATRPSDVHQFLLQQGMSLDTPITARDIMRPARLVVNTQSQLRDVTRAMFEAHVEAVPVENESQDIVGEITCDLLFKKGVPDFFSTLASVAFIKKFDPFEKYFEDEANSVAGDVMSEDFAAMEEDATLMEIVYLLSVRNYAKIYVIRDGKQVGIIDRIGVLNRILNL